jgi:hypothetical protein
MRDDAARLIGGHDWCGGRREASRALIAPDGRDIRAVDRRQGTDAAVVPMRAIGSIGFQQTGAGCGIAMVGESVHDGVLLLKLGALQDGRSTRDAM